MSELIKKDLESLPNKYIFNFSFADIGMIQRVFKSWTKENRGHLSLQEGDKGRILEIFEVLGEATMDKYPDITKEGIEELKDNLNTITEFPID